MSNPLTDKWDKGGMGADEVSKRLNISERMVFPLTRHVQGVYWYSKRKKGKEYVEMYYGHLSRMTELLWGGKTYGVMMNEWFIDPNLVVPMEYADRIMGFLRMQGLPIIKVRYKGEHVIIRGLVDHHARARFFR